MQPPPPPPQATPQRTGCGSSTIGIDGRILSHPRLGTSREGGVAGVPRGELIAEPPDHRRRQGQAVGAALSLQGRVRERVIGPWGGQRAR